MICVNFITEDKMLKNTYLYENRMFTNKVKCRIIWVGIGIDRVTLIKNLNNARAEEAFEGHAIKYLKGIDLKD
jgi:hypothetical protein